MNRDAETVSQQSSVRLIDESFGSDRGGLKMNALPELLNLPIEG
jgi:hypothetical protein